jgi:hypothetical protein
MKKKPNPKTNNFVIPSDPLDRRSTLVESMIEKKRSSKVFSDKKKEEKKDRCRKKDVDESSL